MSFFFSGVKLDDVMYLGCREGQAKNGNPFVTLSVADSEGHVNDISTSDADSMRYVRSLSQGERVNLRLVVAGGPKRQYAMLERGPNAVQLAGPVQTDMGY